MKQNRLMLVLALMTLLLSVFSIRSLQAEPLDAAYAVTEITLKTTEGDKFLDVAACGATPSTACVVETLNSIEGATVTLRFPENGVRNVTGNLLGIDYSFQTQEANCRYGDDVCYDKTMAYLNPRNQNGGYFVGKHSVPWNADATGTIVVNAGGKSQTFYLRGARVGVLDPAYRVTAVHVKTSGDVVSRVDIDGCGASPATACTVRTSMPIKGVSVALGFREGAVRTVTGELLGNKFTKQSEAGACAKGDEVCYEGNAAYINPVKQNGGELAGKPPVPWGPDATGKLVINAGGQSQTIYLNGKSSNANLTGLGLSVGDVTPGFAPSVTKYFKAVPNSVTSVTVKPTRAQAGATVKVNGAELAGGAASAPIPLGVGGNTIVMKVTAQNGEAKTYYVVVGRGTASMVDIAAARRKPCSDWINVRTQKPAAVGDGVADDTAAIQAAFNRIGNQTPGTQRDLRALLTVYLPAGTYRITRSLTISDIGKVYQGLLGILVVGDGALTRIVWDGPKDAQAQMLVTNGTAYGRFDGIVFDGAGKAGYGLDHASTRTFETEVDHYSLSFRNFLGAGLRVGSTGVASSEMVIKNCVFSDSAGGLQLLAFNDYDNVVTGCQFQRCDRAIVLGYGCNAYIRNSHFEGSAGADIAAYGPYHPCSIRRCTSLGSRRFLDWSASTASITVQDCQVASWTSPEGAVVFHDALVPVQLLDTTFTNPPAGSPPVYNASRTLMTSNISHGGSPQLLGLTSGPLYSAPIDIPKGTHGGWLKSASQTFIEPVTLPSVIFDARALGAIGDGLADDTVAVQKTIDAARQRGEGALAYFPPGLYRVTKTIEMTGRNYTVGGGGSGFYTELSWAGPEGGTMLHIHDVDGVRLERLCVGSSGTQGKNSIDILQDGTTPGTMQYENVWVFGTYAHAPTTRGLRIEGAPAGSTIQLRHVSGNVNVNNCSRARILADVTWEGALTVSGTEPVRDGLFASASRFNSSEPFGVYVKDNQSAVLTDFYSESADAYLYLSGAEGQPPGRVTVAGIKIDVHINPAVLVENYAGQLSMLGSQFYEGAYELEQRGERPLDLVLAASMHTSNPKVGVTLGAKSRLTPVGNYWAGGPENKVTTDGLDRIAVALDDFSMLGALDLKVNHPGLMLGAFPASVPAKTPAME